MDAKLLAGLAFTILSAGLLRYAVTNAARARRSAGWPSVLGRVTHAEVVHPKTTSPRRDFQVSYAYAVEGSEFEGFRAAAYTIAGKQQAEALLAQFPQGAEVPVYYDPANPGDAVLVPGPRGDGKPHSEIAIALIGLVAGLAITMWALFD